MSDNMLTAIAAAVTSWVLLAPLVGGYVGARLALAICQRNFDCPVRRENVAKKWTRSLEQKRGG
jgi:hypothetical protein